jgi:hypothetical protein
MVSAILLLTVKSPLIVSRKRVWLTRKPRPRLDRVIPITIEAMIRITLKRIGSVFIITSRLLKSHPPGEPFAKVFARQRPCSGKPGEY